VTIGTVSCHANAYSWQLSRAPQIAGTKTERSKDMARRQTSEGTPTLRQALRRAKALGLQVGNNRGTGEVRIKLQGVGTVNHNARRKDASRALLHLIRVAEERHTRGGPLCGAVGRLNEHGPGNARHLPWL
jgi:hypothetical protein